MSELFYYRQKKENQEFFFIENILYMKRGSEEIPVIEIAKSDSPNGSFNVLKVLKISNFSVLQLSWRMLRNIICLDNLTGEVMWRINPPRNVWPSRENYWIDIYKSDEYPDGVLCDSVDGYMAICNLKSGSVITDRDPSKDDPRDF